MLRAIKGRVDDRVLRLFAVAACRSIWHALSDSRSCRAVEVAERYANGTSTAEELAEAAAAAKQAFDELISSEVDRYDTDDLFRRRCDAAQAVMDVARPNAWTGAWNTAMLLDWEREEVAKCLRVSVGAGPAWHS